MTVREVADLLRVHPHTVRRLIRDAELASYRVGRQIRVRRDDVEEYIRRQLAAG